MSPRAPVPAGVALLAALAALAARAWQILRTLSGDADYDSYLEHAGETPLSRKAFYLETLQRRYSRPNRCC